MAGHDVLDSVCTEWWCSQPLVERTRWEWAQAIGRKLHAQDSRLQRAPGVVCNASFPHLGENVCQCRVCPERHRQADDRRELPPQLKACSVNSRCLVYSSFTVVSCCFEVPRIVNNDCQRWVAACTLRYRRDLQEVTCHSHCKPSETLNILLIFPNSLCLRHASADPIEIC